MGDVIRTVAACLALATWASAASSEELTEAERQSNLGAKYAARGDYHRAAAAFRKAIREDPFLAIAHYNLGLAFLKLKDFEDAAHAFDSAVRTEPGASEAWFHLGLSLMALKDFEKAASAFEQTLVLTPENPTTRYRLGQVFGMLGRWDGVVEQWEALLLDAPGYDAVPRIREEMPQAYFNLGAMRHTAGERHKAEDAYEEALRLDPDHLPAIKNLGLLTRELEDYARSVELFEQGLKIDPTNASIAIALAVSHSLQGLHEEADSLLQAVRGRGDLPVDTYHALAENQIRRGDVTAARASAEAVVRLTGSDIRALKVLAFVHEHNKAGERYGDGYDGRYVSTIYRRALGLAPKDASLHFNLGVVHAKAERWEAARTAFNKALAHNPKHAGAQEGLLEIEQITGKKLIRVR